MKSTDFAVTDLVGTGAPPSVRAQMRSGQFWMLAGAVVTLLGVTFYATTMLIGDVNQEPARYWTEGLATIGAGVVVWLLGTFKLLMALRDAVPSDEGLEA
jgi:hypothetical protein